MTKYMVYADDEAHPGTMKLVKKKIKHEREAFDFIADVRNLQQYGCMTVIKDTDDQGSFFWNKDTNSWEHMEA